MQQNQAVSNPPKASTGSYAWILMFAFLMVLWVATWVLKLAITGHMAFFATPGGNFLYWTLAKVLIWILPSLWLVRRSGRKVRSLFHFHLWRKYIPWGCAIGGFLVALNAADHFMKRIPLLPSELTFPLINVIVIAPVFEEFTMRGVIYTALRERHSFLLANSVTALLFVLLHCPGWYFMGSLWTNLTTPLGGALAIYFIGWLCGLAAERGKSVLAAMIVHFANNLTS